jgi:hypothetical protein
MGDSEKNIVCLNCESIVHDKDKFCGNCGQSTKSLKRPFLELVIEFVKSTFNIDNRFFSTILRVLFVPWKIINDYFNGKRTKYMHPVRLFLFSNLAIFTLAIFLVDSNATDKIDTTFTLNGKDMTKDSVKSSLPGHIVFDRIKVASVGELQTWEKINQDNAIELIYNTDSTVYKLFSSESGWFSKKINQNKLLFVAFKFLVRYQLYGANGLSIQYLSLFSKLNIFLIPLFALISFLFFKKKRPYFISHIIFMLFFFSSTYLLQSLGLLLDFFIDTKFIFATITYLLSTGIFVLTIHFVFRYRKRGTILRLLGFLILTGIISTIAMIGGLIYALTGSIG